MSTDPFGSAAGFGYIEALISIVLVALILVPTMESLQPVMQRATVHEAASSAHYGLKAKLEETLSLPYAELLAEAQVVGNPQTPSTLYSDAVAAPGRRLVYLANIDADNADVDDDPLTGVETDLLWIKVAVANSHHLLESVTSADD